MTCASSWLCVINVLPCSPKGISGYTDKVKYLATPTFFVFKIEFNRKGKKPICIMLSGKKTSEIQTKNLFIEGVIYINSTQWLMAYLVFETIFEKQKNKTIPVLYNFALCNFHAQKYKTTISLLNETLRHFSFKMASNNSNNTIPDALFENEYNNTHYKKALSTTISELNQAEIKLRIRRLLIDTYLEIENWQEIIRLSKLTDMAKCKNVSIAYEKAQLAIQK